MRCYLTAFMLAFALMFGLVGTAYASSESTSSAETFNWSAVVSKALTGVVVAAPAVVYFVVNNKKDE